MTILFTLLLAISLIGTASSTVFLGLALVAAARHLRAPHIGPLSADVGDAAANVRGAARNTALPPVSILKPLHGAEPRLEENLESFFLQDYPDFEILFGCRNPTDPALAVVERLRARHPQVRTRVVLSGEPGWPNAKVWSLGRMIAASTRDYFVLSDSDILVSRDFLRAVIPPLLNSPPLNPPKLISPMLNSPKEDARAGLVTCLYRGVPAAGPGSPVSPGSPDSLLLACGGGGLWSHLEALGMSVELPSGVLTADMLEGMRFALGAVIAVRRDAFEKIGGIASTREYYSDDFVLGQRVYEAGYRVVLSPHRVAHVLCAQSLAQTFATQVRWMQSTRYSRPRGHLGTGLTFACPSASPASSRPPRLAAPRSASRCSRQAS